MARARTRGTRARIGGVASSLEIGGAHIPIKVKRPTLEIAKESGANITVRNVPGGYKGIFVGTNKPRPRRPTSRQAIDQVRDWADRFREMHKVAETDFASRVNYVDEKGQPTRPKKKGAIGWIKGIRKAGAGGIFSDRLTRESRKAIKAHEFAQSVMNESWQGAMRHGTNQRLTHPNMPAMFLAFEQAIAAEERRLVEIITRERRQPSPRELKQAEERVNQARQAISDAVIDFSIRFSEIRGLQKMPKKGKYPPFW